MLGYLAHEALTKCEADSRRALNELTAAITALESLPPMRNETENDAVVRALHAARAAFFYTYSCEFAAGRALT